MKRYSKKHKHKLDINKIQVKKEEDLTPGELYKEQLRSKIRRRH